MYEYFDHRADIGIRGFGKTLEEAFQEAAKAMFGVMGNIKNVDKKSKIEIKCEADDDAGLFIEFLNTLLAEADINRFFFSDFKIKIKKNNKYKLSGYAFGEKRNPEKHELKLEVKAATFSQLKVEKSGDKFIVQCVVDV
ncbi:MAG: archease [Candidatus Aenigmatarchaeota archaeon]